jgi:hypothetical protein
MCLVIAGLLAYAVNLSLAQTHRNGSPVSQVHPHKITRPKQDVLTLVCQDVLKWEGLKDRLQNVAKHHRSPQFVNENRPVGKELGDNMLVDIENGKTKAIPKSLVAELVRRNPRDAPLIGFAPPAPYIPISSAEEKAQYDFDSSHRPDYDFSAFIMHMALPAFSADRREALVFFTFSQGVGGLHGGGYGFYHLVRSRGRWQIRTKYVTFLT